MWANEKLKQWEKHMGNERVKITMKSSVCICVYVFVNVCLIHLTDRAKWIEWVPFSCWRCRRCGRWWYFVVLFVSLFVLFCFLLMMFILFLISLFANFLLSFCWLLLFIDKIPHSSILFFHFFIRVSSHHTYILSLSFSHLLIYVFTWILSFFLSHTAFSPLPATPSSLHLARTLCKYFLLMCGMSEVRREVFKAAMELFSYYVCCCLFYLIYSFLFFFLFFLSFSFSFTYLYLDMKLV